MFSKEVMEMKNEIEKIKHEEQSFAMEFVKSLKIQNKRMFICWIITFIAFIGLLAYTIWLHNDIVETTTTEWIDIEQVETIDSSTIQIGG